MGGGDEKTEPCPSSCRLSLMGVPVVGRMGLLRVFQRKGIRLTWAIVVFDCLGWVKPAVVGAIVFS